MNFLKNFWRDETGQDLIEYTLLLAFICLLSAAIFIAMGGSLKNIWTCASTVAASAPGAS